jgi:hypothetical protein
MDWSDEIQALWDPNYFLQIASKFPFFINGKCCGFFLAHEEGFSSGMYANLQHSSKGIRRYLEGFSRLIEHIDSNQCLSEEHKLTARKFLVKFFRTNICSYIRGYMLKKKYKDACYTSLLTLYFLGVNRMLFKRRFPQKIDTGKI